MTPNSGTAPVRIENTDGHSETFTVQNTGSAQATFSFTRSCSNGVTCGTAPANVTLSAGAQTTVSQSYSVGSPGEGTITLTATGTNAQDSGSYTVPIEPVYVAASVVNGDFVIASQYVLQETAESYDGVGRITELTDARGATTLYEYGGPNDAYLTKVTRERDGTGTVDLVTELTYDVRGRVETLTDEGGTTRRFSYDGFGRLTEVRNRGNDLVEAYAYHYSRTSGSNWTFNPAEPNRIETTTYRAHVPSTASTVTREWLDGLGRPVQVHMQDSVSRYVVQAASGIGLTVESAGPRPGEPGGGRTLPPAATPACSGYLEHASADRRPASPHRGTEGCRRPAPGRAPTGPLLGSSVGRGEGSARVRVGVRLSRSSPSTGSG